jgi:hypothetical protein
MGARSYRFSLRARVRPLGDAERDHAPDARSDGRPGLPELHGSVPSIRRAFLGKGIQLCLVGRDDHRGSFVLTAIGLGIVIVGVLVVSNVWKTPNYNVIWAWDPEVSRLTGRQHGVATSRSTGSNWW